MDFQSELSKKASINHTHCIVHTYTPIITATGGAGNTIPVYTTNSGRYFIVGNLCFVEIHFEGDGGNEGAGTGSFTVSLPKSVSASKSPAGYQPVGFAYNSTTEYMCMVALSPSATTTTIRYWTSISATANLTLAMQNNANRYMHLNFWYEI